MAEAIRHIWLGADALATALGDRAATLTAIEAGRTGLAASEALRMVCGAIPSDTSLAEPLAGYTRMEALMIRTIGEVVAQSGVRLDDARVQLIVSTTKGNIDRLKGCGAEPPEEAFIYACARRVAEYFGAARRPIAVSNACISGLSALIVGQRLLLAGECDAVVIAGCDLLSEFIAEGFRSFKSVSERPCRPYDAERDGLSLGEACGALLLTADREQAQEPAIELLGGAVTNDANHISGPSRTGDGLYYAIREAMEQAGIGPEAVGLVNAHGTATLYNDEMESKALVWAGLDGVPMNGLKGYFGHTLGASGVVETIVCAEQLRRGIVYGTKGYESSGVPFALNLSPQQRPLEQPCCVKTASGFGGCNAAVVLAGEGCGTSAFVPADICRIVERAAYRLPQSSRPFAEFIREEFRALEAPDMKFYKMSDLSKALYMAVERLLRKAPLDGRFAPTEVALVLSNRAASLDTDLEHQRILDEGAEPASPAVFVYTLPNVAAGEACIRHRIQGDNTFFIDDGDDASAERYARLLLEQGHARAVICGRCELLGGEWDVALELLEAEEIIQ